MGKSNKEAAQEYFKGYLEILGIPDEIIEIQPYEPGAGLSYKRKVLFSEHDYQMLSGTLALWSPDSLDRKSVV